MSEFSGEGGGALSDCDCRVSILSLSSWRVHKNIGTTWDRHIRADSWYTLFPYEWVNSIIKIALLLEREQILHSYSCPEVLVFSVRIQAYRVSYIATRPFVCEVIKATSLILTGDFP